MNCFVIMPFAEEFDDVYAAMRAAVEGACSSSSLRCFRLDESRPAGRITDRLLRELTTARMCVADLTGARPNVMWEVGYAMALGTPTIIAVQSMSDLPFDLKDMQTLLYDRKRLRQTLTVPLGAMVQDTLRASRAPVGTHRDGRSTSLQQDELVGTLLAEVQELKLMVAESVQLATQRSRAESIPRSARLPTPLEGAWVSPDNGSHYYAKLVRDELVVPYCYTSNDELTGVFFDWQLLGEHWFARFKWLPYGAAGFAFLKQESPDSLVGAYWHDGRLDAAPLSPPKHHGVSLRWRRNAAARFPPWATRFLQRVETHGLQKCVGGDIEPRDPALLPTNPTLRSGPRR
jgi:nucleoside 2-deoxyribosyltransferase